jgi:NAD(P)-dependent dehydrogenase (short-subunit alcohol dehydrogenase family)
MLSTREALMTQICADRVVIVTGAGRGIGRAHALAFAAEGARVVVNDVGSERDGTGADGSAAESVVAEIRAMGGQAVANTGDISDWDEAGNLIRDAVETFGRLDVLVNNAGVLRDRMFVNATVDEWDTVMRVHLRGHFCPTKHAVTYWRGLSKTGQAVDARIINTSSQSGLHGSVGQVGYAAAKAGIASMTLVQAAELGRYGVTANAIAPIARTRMTETVYGDMVQAPESGFDVYSPENISPLVVWLGSSDSSDVTGRVFEVYGGHISVAEGWNSGPQVDKAAQWSPQEVGSAMTEILDRAEAPHPVHGVR